MNAALPKEAVAVAALSIADIAPSPSNPRKHFDDAYIAELAESIKAHGLIQPITVRPIPLDHVFEHNKRRKAGDDSLPPTYEIVVGECRWRAAKLAGLTAIPAFWRELDDKQVLEIQVIENLQRRDVHEIEEAEGYEQLMKLHGYRAEEIAAKIGKSRGYVYARLKLTALCKEAREAFFEGKLDASTALLIARIPGATLQKKAVAKITNGYNGEPLSYRSAVFEIRNNFTISLKQATFSLDDAELVPAAGSCTACPKRSGNAPEICADLDDEDVCTDTGCFDDKRLTRRQQLITNAEKKGIPIFTGDSGWDAFRDERRIDIDEVVEGDGQERSYREILGDKLPRLDALVEVGHGERKRLVEMADVTALEKALTKAGWTPDLFKNESKGPDTAELQQRRKEEEARQVEREARRQATEKEGTWRANLITALLPRIEKTYDDGDLNPDRVLGILAAAYVRQEVEYSYDLPEQQLTRYGITLPKEYDNDEELDRIANLMTTWPAGKALAYLFEALIQAESTPPYDFDAEKHRPHSLLAMSKLLDFDPESLREPASTPCPAAQAQEEGATEPAAPAKAKGKKKAAAKPAEGKADPAPASPANEPATPAKTGALKPADAWPFPEGCRV